MKIFDERGVTLYELLAVLVISMIVLPVIYGVFTSGVKLYNKVQVEGQLRDDADYTVTMIMNTFYSHPFDYVRSCGDNCLELVDSTELSFGDSENKHKFYSVERKEKTNEMATKINLEKIQNGEDSLSLFSIDGKPIDAISDFSNSKLKLISCTKETRVNQCEEGMISIQFYLDDKRLKKPLELHSQFGY